MKELIRKHHVSFKNAFAGLFWALRTQPNFRIHIFLSTIALLGGWYFQVTAVEFYVLFFTILLGLVTEMLNTALEAMTDLITTEWKQEAKIAKDVAAGMMLVVAIGAFILACVIFLPRLLGVL